MSSGYEAECEAYALYGNPARDAADYEDVARYDRYDGWGDPDPCDNPDYDDGPDDLGEEALQALCEDMVRADLEDYEEIDENGVGYDNYSDRDDIPF